MAERPKAYNDPYWSELIARVEEKEGIPRGLLHSIVNHGERTNDDQVSSAGAKTIFQIIPETARGIIKNYGIDPYLSPYNAATGAAKVLKENLARYNNNIPMVVAAYHGGHNKSAWGKITNQYVRRVVDGFGQQQPKQEARVIPASANNILNQSDIAGEQQSDSVDELMQKYKKGELPPEQSAEFIQNVKNGKIFVGKRAAQDIGITEEEPKPAQDDRETISQFAKFVSQKRGIPNIEQQDPSLLGQINSFARGAAAGAEKSPLYLGRAVTYPLAAATGITAPDEALKKGIQYIDRTAKTYGESYYRDIDTGELKITDVKDSSKNKISDAAGEASTSAILPAQVAGKALGAAAGAIANTAPKAAKVVGGVGNFVRGAGDYTPVQTGINAAAGGTMEAIQENGGSFGQSIGGGLGAAVALGVLAKKAGLPTTMAENAARTAAREANILTEIDTLAAQKGISRLDAALELRVRPEQLAAAEAAAQTATQTTYPTVALSIDEIPQQQSAKALPNDIAAQAGQEAAAVADEVPFAQQQQVVGAFYNNDINKITDALQSIRGDNTTLEEALRAGGIRQDVIDALPLDLYRNKNAGDVVRELAAVASSQPGSQAANDAKRVMQVFDEAITNIFNKGNKDASGTTVSIRNKFASDRAALQAKEKPVFDQLEANVLARDAEQGYPIEADVTNLKTFLDDQLRGARGIVEKDGVKTGVTLLEEVPSVVRELHSKVYNDEGKILSYPVLNNFRKKVGAALGNINNAYLDADQALVGKVYDEVTEALEKTLETNKIEGREIAFDLTRRRKALEESSRALFGKKLDKDIRVNVNELANGKVEAFSNTVKNIPEEYRRDFVQSQIANAFYKGDQMRIADFNKWWVGVNRNKESIGALRNAVGADGVTDLNRLHTISNYLNVAKTSQLNNGKALGNLFKDLAKAADDSTIRGLLRTVPTLIGQVSPQALSTIMRPLTSKLGLPAVKSADQALAEVWQVVNSDKVVKAMRQGDKAKLTEAVAEAMGAKKELTKALKQTQRSEAYKKSYENAKNNLPTSPIKPIN